MKKFTEWLNQQQVDDSAITKIYDKARISVDLVKRYRPDLLKGIAVIANLASGAYGIYTHYQLQNQQSRPITYGDQSPDITSLSPELVRKMHPDIDTSDLKKGDVVRVNVQRILHDPKVKSEIEAIMHIAATIVHELTHHKEVQQTGQTSETGPEKAQAEFINLLSRPEVQKQIQDEMGKYTSRQPQFGT